MSASRGLLFNGTMAVGRMETEIFPDVISLNKQCHC